MEDKYDRYDSVSINLCNLLEWLDNNALYYDKHLNNAIFENLYELAERNTEEKKIAFMEDKKFINSLTNIVVTSKTSPLMDSLGNFEGIEDEFLGNQNWIEDLYNAYLTREILEEIPIFVERIKHLESIKVNKMPNDKIRNYFVQASRCYMYGLYDATAVLSRSLLEFTLEEYLESPDFGDIENGKGYLEKLIIIALRKNIISKEDKYVAHQIRKIGNKAVHKNSTTQMEACISIKNVVSLVSKVYSRK
ncbi:MAG: DUF4145 domain-containing protein [Deltaproteobacteria bacterium]|nr:MAG: DUF4145 domain-containing protein [Deltaproteobacteria bacterium]